MSTVQAIWYKNGGTQKGYLNKAVQGSTLETITILALYDDGTSIDLSSMTITGVKTDYSGAVTSITGTLTGANGSFTWAYSTADVGAAGWFKVRFTYTDGSKLWESQEIRWLVEISPEVTAIAGSALTGVSAAEAAFITASETAGNSATDDNLTSWSSGALADSGYGILDEDNMASNSATDVSTQQALVAYNATHYADLTTHGFYGVQAAPLTTSELTASGMWGLCSSGNQLHANIGGTVFAFPAVSAYPAIVLNNSPIAYLRLDELAGTVAKDSGSGGLDSTYTGNVTLASILAPFENYAALFATSGTDGYVQIPVGFDAVFDGAEGAVVIIAKVLDSSIWTDAAVHYTFRVNIDGNNDIFISKDSTDNRLVFRRTAGGTNSIVNLDSVTSTDWMVLGIEWSEAGDYVKAYYNGVQTGSTQTSIGTWAGGALNKRVIGKDTSQTWDGYLAEVSFYDAPLGATVMAALATDALG